MISTRYQRLVGGIGRTIWTSSLFYSIASLAFPLAHRGYAVPLLFAGTLVIGFGGMVYNIAQVSYRQAICPQRMQGRMNATMRFLVWGTIPIGSIVDAKVQKESARVWTEVKSTLA